MNKTGSALLFFAVIFVACKKDNTDIISPPANETDFGTYSISTYMPMSIGNRWIYDYENTAERAVLDRRVRDTLRAADQLLMFRYSEDVLVANPPPDQPVVGYVSHRGGTIYHGYVYGSTNSAKLPLLASPLVVGHRWWSGTAGQRDSFEIVNVSPGQFNSQVVDTVVVVRHWSNSVLDSLWFGRTIGILKQRTISIGVGSSIRNLRSFALNP